ncbi:uncharacterized protein N7459_009773 [Penicillium hispanicum]|uniref:uncharacterized protein n=1 Tax=Penicillium hispanicum TaxID=1080232 RepID=UPI0025411BF7|nr:uncharacterized protein N7459_009773 [Penicillium hispanicum]KAJ5570343.1 hypothetical protein N7459_009773 [Penicillium hispanicum]
MGQLKGVASCPHLASSFDPEEVNISPTGTLAPQVETIREALLYFEACVPETQRETFQWQGEEYETTRPGGLPQLCVRPPESAYYPSYGNNAIDSQVGGSKKLAMMASMLGSEATQAKWDQFLRSNIFRSFEEVCPQTFGPQ